MATHMRIATDKPKYHVSHITTLFVDILCLYIYLVLKSRPELRDLYSLVTPHYAAHWKVIGIQLGLLEGRLNAIELGYPTNASWCCNKMFEELLKVNTTVTWEKVLSAIDSTATLCTLDSGELLDR